MGCGKISKVHSVPQDQQNSSLVSYNNNVTVLFLGVPNSGKSTIVKQIRVLYNVQFTDLERKSARCAILSHINNSISSVLDKLSQDQLQPSDMDYENAVHTFHREAPSLDSCSPNQRYPEFLNMAKELWGYNSVRECFERIRPLTLDVNSGGYFLKHLDRLLASDFTPSDTDMVNTRLITTGIQETEFRFRGRLVKVIDVAGQRSERRKWMNCFDRVDFIVYCASLIDFSIESESKASENAMLESFGVFESVINSVWFQDKPIIVYLTKPDLLQSLFLQNKETELHFGKFGTFTVNSYQNALDVMKDMYRLQNHNHNRQIFFHVLRATDKADVKKVFENSTDQMMQLTEPKSKLKLKILCTSAT